MFKMTFETEDTQWPYVPYIPEQFLPGPLREILHLFGDEDLEIYPTSKGFFRWKRYYACIAKRSYKLLVGPMSEFEAKRLVARLKATNE